MTSGKIPIEDCKKTNSFIFLSIPLEHKFCTFLFTNKGRGRIKSSCYFIVESTQNFLVTKHSLFERSWVIYTRNTEDGSWHASPG